MVEQHIYTRAIKSLYSGNAGYGSVAKSCGLDDEFVIDVLEPLCKIPGAYIINFPGGYDCMVVGSSVSRTDFTGDRQTGFFHNYVFDAEGINCVMKLEYPGIVGGFMEEYEDCGLIPEISVDLVTGCETEYFKAFDADMYGRELVLELMYAFAVCKKLGRKVYLGICMEEVSSLSVPLFSYIISLLPFPLRTVLGFMSFSPEPQPHKGFDIIGIDGRSLDTDMFDGDYFFIIKEESFISNVPDVRQENGNEIEDRITGFLEFLISGDAGGYMDYAEDVLAVSRTDIKADIITYIEIYDIYRTISIAEESQNLNLSLSSKPDRFSNFIRDMLLLRERTGYGHFAENLLDDRNLAIFNACGIIMLGKAEIDDYGELSTDIKCVLTGLFERDGQPNFHVVRACFVSGGITDCVKFYETSRDIAAKNGRQNALNTCVQCFKWMSAYYPEDTFSENFYDAVGLFTKDFSEILTNADMRNRYANELNEIPGFDRFFSPTEKTGLFKRIFNRGKTR